MALAWMAGFIGSECTYECVCKTNKMNIRTCGKIGKFSNAYEVDIVQIYILSQSEEKKKPEMKMKIEKRIGKRDFYCESKMGGR